MSSQPIPTTAAAATTTAQDENEANINKENTTTPPLPSQSSQVQLTTTPTPQTPTLTQRVYMGSQAEDEMIDQIDLAIRRLLTQPNHQSPYRYDFEWTINHGPTSLNYIVLLTIREPPI